MNYYSRYPGHYLAATVHLTMEQDGAYNRLLDWCYLNESGIPDERKYSIGRAQKPSEKRAILHVLSEFFSLENGFWIQNRVVIEIEKSSPRIEAARINGLRGGRPKKTKPGGLLNRNPVGFSEITQKEPSTKAPQSPITKKQQEQNQKISPAGAVEVITPSGESDLAGQIPEKPDKQAVPFVKIVELYHTKLPMMPRVEKLTDKRRGYIRQRWLNDLQSLEAWANYFDHVSRSVFLTGRAASTNGRPPFMANLEWICNPTNFTNIAEDKYHR